MKTPFTAILKTCVFFITLFVIKPAEAQTQLVPYPATDHGQSLTITSNSQYWGDLMDASSQSRDIAQTTLNNGGTPSDIWTCNNTVCCQTVAFYCSVHSIYHYL